jgi:hypothetical protein
VRCHSDLTSVALPAGPNLAQTVEAYLARKMRVRRLSVGYDASCLDQPKFSAQASPSLLRATALLTH